VVLALSLGASAIYAVIRIVAAITAPRPLAEQQARLNATLAPDRPWLDLTLQLTGIVLGLAPVALALHLLARTDGPPAARIGLDGRRPLADLGTGAVLALVVGVPGLALYLAARALGVNTTVVPVGLPDVWWQVPVLVLAAAQNAVLEEVVVVGYLLVRLEQLGWSPWRAVAASALLRGAYHLYQGFGGFLGNLAMGLLFGWLYARRGRVAPLVVAHTLLDLVAFVGYALLRGRVGWLP